jgi:hypothetical protein
VVNTSPRILSLLGFIVFLSDYSVLRFSHLSVMDMRQPEDPALAVCASSLKVSVVPKGGSSEGT